MALGQHVAASALLIVGVVKVEAQVWTREGDLQFWFGHAHLGSRNVSAQGPLGTYIPSWNLHGRTRCSWAPG